MRLHPNALFAYTAFLAICALLLHFEALPFPYHKFPLGMIIGSLSSILLVGMILAPFTVRQGNLFPITCLALGIAAFIAFIQRLLPLNLDFYHITTNSNRVSLLIGMIIGAIMVIVFKYTSRKPVSVTQDSY